MISIKVLGPGCANCEKLESLTQSAIGNLGLDARIEKVTDFGEIMQYNVLATPGLVIDEQLVSAGQIPSEGEITAWLANTQA
jgi:small redox-active disulfide protein 2